ncbi:hypothetical protein B0H13DRAFT_1874880 [Mycena leptocephala]|nr:hypothetical protein B0H13DRAFT_1874880 [Mycena leptocephala]
MQTETIYFSQAEIRSADEWQIVRRSSADDLPLICRQAATHNECCVQAGGTLWNHGDINECEGWTFCCSTWYTGGGDLADTNSTGQPRSPAVAPTKEVIKVTVCGRVAACLQMSGRSSAEDRRTIRRSSADRISA